MCHAVDLREQRTFPILAKRTEPCLLTLRKHEPARQRNSLLQRTNLSSQLRARGETLA